MTDLKQLETLLSKGKITRREFLARVSALGITAAVAPGLLAKPAQAATPKKGGRFRMSIGGGATTNSLDPSTFDDQYMLNVSWQLRNNLVECDHRFTPIPELAEGWEASSDASKWTFMLRRGVEFHNGKSLDAEDVIYSLSYHRGEDSKSAAKSLLDPIKEIKADGKYTVVFTLAGGNADFPMVLADYHLPIVPNGTKGDDWEKGIGTGGYILEKFEPGVRTHTKRNPNYWKEGRAHFDEVETLSVTDINSRTNALMTGQVDFANRLEVKTIHLLEKSPNTKVIKYSGTWHFSMPMLTDVPPYDNNDVRLALKYAIDREQLLKITLRGFGSVGNDHPIAPIQRYYASELPQREYDPDKAKYHLKKAGMMGHTFKLYASPEAGFIDTAILYKEQAAKAGLNLEVVRTPVDGYWSDVWMKKPFVGCYWAGRSTEDLMFTTAYAADAPWNDSHWKHERFNKLLVEARAELDEKKRREMYVEMQSICRDEGGVIVHLFKDFVEAIDKKVKHSELAGNWESDGGRNAERWWFES